MLGRRRAPASAPFFTPAHAPCALFPADSRPPPTAHNGIFFFSPNPCRPACATFPPRCPGRHPGTPRHSRPDSFDFHLSAAPPPSDFLPAVPGSAAVIRIVSLPILCPSPHPHTASAILFSAWHPPSLLSTHTEPGPVPVSSTCLSQNEATILHWAAEHGHLDLVNKLFAMGANIDAKDNNVSPWPLPPHSTT
jgi:hypothetical protein